MGSKTVNKSHKSKRVLRHRCHVCGQSLATESALTSHLERIHCLIPQNTPSSDKRVGILRKGVSFAEDVEPKAEILPKKRVIRTDMEYTKDIHFACPKCERLFKSNFSARQHIVRYHCVNDKDEPVAENSPDIIKPIGRERCLKCQANVNSDDFHMCSIDPNELAATERIVCLGCDQGFSSVKLFDIHVPMLHSDGVEAMFFKKQDDLIEWISEMEDSTGAKYKLMNYNSLRQVYRCTYLPDNNTDSYYIKFCPSSLHIQEFSRGFQVNFHTRHYGHVNKTYQVKEKYKKNTITSLLQKDSNTNVSKSLTEQNILYMQFKSVMEKMILEAEKLKPEGLREVMGIALEMSAVLNYYEGTEAMNDRIPHCALNLNDSQISDALMDTDKSQRKKRKSSISPIPNVEMEVVEDSPQLKSKKSTGKRKLPLTVCPPSLNNENKDKIEEKKEKDPITSPKTRFLSSLSEAKSFNDTYKSFLGKSLTEVPPTDNKKSLRSFNNRKKNIVKTKMGQFKPNSPKKATPTDVKLESPPQSPVTFDTMPKDISYEIKEQENDLNILILKF